jgi:alpha-amylase/alpha-mannosidase (GH57 family)
MADIALAFLWHQHQPYYPDDPGGENPMPWVRLHGVKDYYGMAMHLLEFPEMRCTINMVPSLLVQLQAYIDGKLSDRPLDVTRIPADGLSEADCLYLLDHFFMANPQHMIRPHTRYMELYQRRAAWHNTAQEARRRFKEREYRDLQVWFNLAWIHPLAVERDRDLQELHKKGRNFSEEEKNLVLAKHREILASIVPLHKKLVENGQIELTTTPFFHPILPLLLDKKLAREAIPEARLPHYSGGYPDDATVHVRRAIAYHSQVFGTPPIGMWPAEGSVCQSLIPLLAENGIRWIATDEEILSQSTQGFVSRDEHGHVRNPELLYRPYRVSEGGHDLQIVFRDHVLSDKIGFHYQRSNAVDAAEDFLHNLHNIGKAVHQQHPALVSVILDGENCWEHYPDGGVPFLRALYERCTKTSGISTVTLGNYLEKYPPHDTLPRLFAGSWIHHNFAIWIGHEEDNTAWDALHQAREHLRARAGLSNMPSENVRKAWDEIYIAEGSDWYWWYGDDHSSAQDALFDRLFRKHLQNVYLLLGDAPPPDLARPISRRGERVLHTMPRSFLDVKIDGRETFFEWIAAGRYTCMNERGTMALATPGPIKEVLFGFDLKRLLIRVDFDGPALSALADLDGVRLGFVEPANWEVLIKKPGRKGQSVVLGRHGELKENVPATIEVGVNRILEAAIPFDLLGVKADQAIQFFVEVLDGKQSRDRAPREGAIHLTCPSPDFEQIMWNV